MSKIQWLTTMPNPRSPAHTCGADDGQVGWRLHAVEADEASTLGEVGSKSAACGLRPAHGWGIDMFIERKCSRCLRKLDLACPVCRGLGGTRHVSWCSTCLGTGERPATK